MNVVLNVGVPDRVRRNDALFQEDLAACVGVAVNLILPDLDGVAEHRDVGKRYLEEAVKDR